MPRDKVVFIKEEAVKGAKEKGVCPAEWLIVMMKHGGAGIVHNDRGISGIFSNPPEAVVGALREFCNKSGLESEAVQVL